MAMNRTSFSSLLVEGLREVFFEWLDPNSLVYPKLYDVRKSKKEKETDRTIAGIDMFSAKSEGVALTYDDFIEAYEKVYTHTTYAKGIRITQELLEDELYGVMGKRTQALANSARYRMEYDHASLFNNATSTSAPYSIAGGEALIETTHARADGGTAISNYATSDLSISALETAVIAFQTMKNDRGLLVAIEPKTLLVPPNLWLEAHEILDSTAKPYTADNETNVLKGMFDIVVWPFLTDTNGWFLLADKRYGAPVSFNRAPVSFDSEGDFDTGDSKVKGRMRYSFGATDWRWCYGSAGST